MRIRLTRTVTLPGAVISSDSSPRHCVVTLTVGSSLQLTQTAAQSLCSQNGEVVLSNGAPAPGLPGFTIYTGSSFAFGTPVIDQDGNLVDSAELLAKGPMVVTLFRGHW